MSLFKTIAALSLFFLCVACYKPTKEVCILKYAFDFPIQVTPKDTFHIGDTIWYSMDIPNQLTNNFDGEKVDLSNFELYYNFWVQSRDSVVTGFSPHYKFDYVAEIGSTRGAVNGFSYKYFEFESMQDKRFKIGVIPKFADTYISSISLPFEYYDKEQDRRNAHYITTEECIEKFVDYDNYPVNSGNSNHYLIDGYCTTNSEGKYGCYDKKPRFDSLGGFAFVVIP